MKNKSLFYFSKFRNIVFVKVKPTQMNLINLWTFSVSIGIIEAPRMNTCMNIVYAKAVGTKGLLIISIPELRSCDWFGN